MLRRIQELIVKHNPDLAGSKRYTIKPPQVVRVGSKKVCISRYILNGQRQNGLGAHFGHLLSSVQ